MPKIERVTEIEDTVPEETVQPQALEETRSEPLQFLSLELLDESEALFRVPTVYDLKRAEAVEGAVKNGQFQANYFIQLARETCVNWGNQTAMPSPQHLDAADYQELVSFFGDYKQHLQQLAEQVGYTVSQDNSHEVELTGGDRLVFRRLTQSDIEQAGKVTGNAETNVRVAAACLVSWNGKPLTWGVAYKRFGELDVPNYVRVTNTLSKFFRPDTSRPRQRRFL